MHKTCLIIDDNLQDEVIEKIVNKLKGKNIDIKCLQFNIGSLERSDLLTEGKIDITKVINQFQKEFTSIKIDLICIDYNLEDEEINGLDILRDIHKLRSTSLFIMYSSNLNQLVQRIIDGYDQGNDPKKIFNKIKFLIRYKIHDFVGRDNYDDVVINLLSKNSQTLESMVEEKLLEYPDMVFQNTYPVFQGKTLLEIAQEIRFGSVHGNDFMKELIEQAISNMILINPYGS